MLLLEIDKNHLKIGLVKIYASTDYGHPEILFLKIPKFWDWTDKLGRKLWGHLEYFGPISINQPLFLQKTKPERRNK